MCAYMAYSNGSYVAVVQTLEILEILEISGEVSLFF
jgi:hypothetical protein